MIVGFLILIAAQLLWLNLQLLAIQRRFHIVQPEAEPQPDDMADVPPPSRRRWRTLGDKP